MTTSTITWNKWPDVKPPALAYGQYERYLIALDTGYVTECSWLFGGWHTSHDGCSNRTEQVRYWAEKPEAPNE